MFYGRTGVCAHYLRRQVKWFTDRRHHSRSDQKSMTMQWKLYLKLALGVGIQQREKGDEVTMRPKPDCHAFALIPIRLRSYFLSGGKEPPPIREVLWNLESGIWWNRRSLLIYNRTILATLLRVMTWES
ncbi:hypothetical protein M378DRAFT_455977 [Amanita muscaria Koide BX008]|uniref:Uncharacterized protein n=1 Tax=Amanita muscaria (strain Koide BX008) TaxID=946122 RepID=A0A0C2S1W7_AMAMK|nr:hypothetical protein M378DRAFT_455977 [Amanita muscaria Koide BX008]